MDHNPPGGYSKRDWLALRENYCTSISDLGGLPLPIPPIHDCLQEYINLIDGLIITGGDFDIHPKFYKQDIQHHSVKVKELRTECELNLFQMALEKNIPILGICGGEQVINVGLGGSLIQHIPDNIENALDHSIGAELAHDIFIEASSLLNQITGKKKMRVNSSHHQSVDRLGKDLRISASASDHVVEAIEHLSHKFCLGLQWHPEFFMIPEDKLILKAFLDAA